MTNAMNRFRKFTFALLLAVMLVPLLSATPSPSKKSAVRATKRIVPTMLSKVDKNEMDTWVNSTFATLTPEERVRQLIVVDIFPEYSEVNRARVKKLVADQKIGGLIYSEGDIRNQAQMTNYAQSLATIPLMITIDGEWGIQMRLSDATKYPRNLTLGAISDDRLFYDYGREVARQCKLMGIQVNFAPVMDVLDNPDNKVIGTRAYGESPEAVARHGISFSKGMEDGGVLSVAKHFPGHGSTIVDSHKAMPTVVKSRKELNMVELLPFRQYVNAGLSGVLTGHLSVPALEKRKIPATMSDKCVNGLLKKEMGFNGLIFTDALVMKGANVSGSVCVNALLAGNDVLLMPPTVDEEVAAIMAAIKNGTLKQSDIDEKCKKMLRYKFALGLSHKPVINLNTVAQEVNSQQAAVMLRRLCAGTITVVKNSGRILPVGNLQSRNIAVLTMGNDNGVKSMFQRRCANYAQTTAYNYNYKAGNSIASLADSIAAHHHDLVIVGVSSDDANYRNALRVLGTKCKNIVLALFNKTLDVRHFASNIDAASVKAVVLGYESSTMAEDYVAQTIFGGNGANGVLPITIKPAGKNRKGKTYRAGYGIKYKANRLGYGIPAEVGLDDGMLHKIDSVANYGVKEHAFPGCEVFVARHGKVVCNRAYGKISYDSKVPVTENTLFGLASVSKATGTLSGLMKLYDDGKIGLDDKLSKFIPQLRDGDKENLTVREALYHETGMQPGLNVSPIVFDRSTYRGALISPKQGGDYTIKINGSAYGNRNAKLRTDILSPEKTDECNVEIAKGIWGGKRLYDTIMNGIYHTPLGQKRYLYSCLNFCLLANAEQNVTHLPLNYFVNNYFFAPLGAYHTLYRPLSKFKSDDIAYTEVDTFLRRQHVHGYVHDELAAFSGGVQGNAGLFSNANDLAKLFQMWLNRGSYGGVRYLKPATVETFLTDKSPNSFRGLGFDKPNVNNPANSSTCDEAPAEVVGHTGFTGTCFWVDPKNDMIYIFLSNRVSPSRNNPNFRRVSARTNIQSIIYKSIIGK